MLSLGITHSCSILKDLGRDLVCFLCAELAQRLRYLRLISNYSMSEISFQSCVHSD